MSQLEDLQKAQDAYLQQIRKMGDAAVQQIQEESKRALQNHADMLRKNIETMYAGIPNSDALKAQALKAIEALASRKEV